MNFGVKTAALLALTLALAACASQSVAPPPPDRVNVSSLPQAASAAVQSDPLAQAVLAAVNGYRAQHDAPALAADGALQRAAAVHSADMALRNFVGHFNPDSQGPRERVAAVLPDYKGSVAENIGVVEDKDGAPEAIASDLVKRWAGSLEHRKNMRNADYTRSGVGIARKGGQIYATEVFAGP